MTDEITEKYRSIWPQAEDNKAAKQGWGIFLTTRSSRLYYEIERIDEMGYFASDDDAILYVREQAKKGDELARAAVLALLRLNPVEAKACGFTVDLMPKPWNCLPEGGGLAWDQFDGIEVQAIVEADGDCCPAEDSQTPDFWTVYGHLKVGGVEALHDCKTEGEAELLGWAILAEFPGFRNVFLGIEPRPDASTKIQEVR